MKVEDFIKQVQQFILRMFRRAITFYRNNTRLVWGSLIAWVFLTTGGLALLMVWINRVLQKFGLRKMTQKLLGKFGLSLTTGKAVDTEQPVEPNQWKTEWISDPYPYGQFGQMNPAGRLIDVVAEFGPPSVIDRNRGGVAIWDKDDLINSPYERIELHDEQIPHSSPAPHTDFLYSWYPINISPEKAANLQKISGSITYDPLKKQLRARCHHMGPNLATTYIVKQYAEGRIGLEEAVTNYGPLIMKLMKEDPNGQLYHQLTNAL